MTLKHICVEFCIVVVIFSVGSSTETKKDKISKETILLTKNISGVNNLLQSVIKNFKELGENDKLDSEETDVETGSDNKRIVSIYPRNKGKLAHKITTRSKAFKGSPIYFSDESWRDGESEAELRKIKDVTENDSNIPDKSRYKKYKTTKEFVNYKSGKSTQVINLKDETESSADESSSAGEVKHDYTNEDNVRKEPSDKKFIVVHRGYRNLSRASTIKHLQDSLNKPKISKSKGKVLENSQAEKEKEEVNSDSHSGEEKALRSEVLKANYLRQAYADACNQVVIRKCFRALRAVSKDICSKSRKCSSKYKDDFRQNGQAACDKEFANHARTCRMGVETSDAEGHSIESRRRKKDIKEPPHLAKDQTSEVNILRDRYEDACKKASFKKCQAACKSASDKTCKQHECISEKKKALKKSCKRRCQETFGYSAGSDESDEDDDEGSE